MEALRVARCFDGERFLAGGATVLVDGARVVGVEPVGHEPPADCPVTSYDGTLLPGLVETHVHLVADSGVGALDRVAGSDDDRIDAVVGQALAQHLAAGVTTVRDLGDRSYAVVARRDRATDAPEPRIVAAGPPVTTPGGHCHYLGGEVDGPDALGAAVRERVARRVDVLKVMTSGGLMTRGTDLTRPQFELDDLRLLVDAAHAAGLPVAAHAHAAAAVMQAVEVGVQSIEHATFLSRRGDETVIDAAPADLDRLAASGIAVCPTLGGLALSDVRQAPPPLLARMREQGVDAEALVDQRHDLLSAMLAAGVRLVSGADAGIGPAKAHGRYAEALLELAEVLPVEHVLRTATSDAAEVCGVGAVTGRIAAGHDADLLLVAGDPARDLATLRSPLAVWRAGVRVPLAA